MSHSHGFIFRFLIALDQFVNVLFGGEPDETISSRWGRTRSVSKVARFGCWCLDKLDPCHCDASIEFDEKGNPHPHHIRKEDEEK